MKQFLLLVPAFLFLVGPGVASADKTDKLVRILIEKQILTADEAESVLEELEGDAKKSPPSEPDGTLSVKYNKGIVFKTADDHYTMKLNARFHGIFSYSNPDKGESKSTFRTRRARILAGGNLFAPWLKYSTQITLEGSEASLRDGYLEASYYKWMTPRLGQYKVPFDREFLDGGFNLQLIDRSIASSEFAIQRDVGLQVSGKKILGAFDYDVGIFNGSGANRNNVDNDYIYVGRLVWGPFGAYPYSESAVDNPSSQKFALGIAGAYMPGLDPGERSTLAGNLGKTSILPVESDVALMTADLAYKYRNFSLMSGYYYRNIDPGAATTFGEQDAWGVYLQGGVFIVPKHFEVAGRYSRIDPDNPEKISDNEKTEYTIGLNYYFSGHSVKTGINYSLFTTDKQSGDEDEQALIASVIFQF